MENREIIRQPELKTEELLALLDSIKWEQGYRFTFNGTEFYINITKAGRLAKAEAEGKLAKFGKSAEYFASTYVRGYDIYLHDTIPESDRRRILFHEILEANLRDQSFSLHEAHDIVLKEEQKAFG
ncbi:MAG: hypothetical protein WC621_03965 [Patescibacteria group bacterium]